MRFRQLLSVLSLWLVAIGFGLSASPAHAQGADQEAAADEAEERPKPSAETESSRGSDDTSSSEFEELMKRARAAYNEENWDDAAALYRRAAQMEPQRAAPYRDLARTFFRQESYARAHRFYRHYLELAPDADDASRIQRESRLASHRAGDRVWRRPKSQRRVADGLREALSDGEAYTQGGGGAWGRYETLLRTGYTHPNLARLQERLRDRLLEEFDRSSRPEPGQPTPVLTLQEWRLQQQRLDAARSLSDEDAVRRRIDRRTRIVEAGTSLLNGRPRDAAQAAAAARETFPDRKYLTWMELAGLIGAEQYDDAIDRIDALQGQSPPPPPTEQRYLKALEATIASRRGNTERAAEVYEELLR